MKRLKFVAMLAVLAFSAAATSGDELTYSAEEHSSSQAAYEYARVLQVRPIYRQVEVSQPVRECWQEPIYHTEHRHSNSAGGMLAGGLLGGIIGHQIGDGRGRKIATAVGTLIGAQIGHQRENESMAHEPVETVRYSQKCQSHHQRSYQPVLDGYDVTYRYRNQRYRVEMPYKPGKRIKLRVEITPVI